MRVWGLWTCGASYNSFTWYQKHVKKIHNEEIDKSSWEASVGSSFLVNLDDTTDPNEVTVTQASSKELGRLPVKRL